MELKEMADIGVIIRTEAEYDEYTAICASGGFHGKRRSSKQTVMIYVNSAEGGYISAGKSFWYGKVALNNGYRELITLAQFKERNGIMKYKQGDVLVANDHEVKILGICGKVYFISEEDDFDNADEDNYTEAWLDNYGYTLKTDEPEMVEVSFKEAAAIVAKDKGVSVEELLIKD